MEDNQEDKSSVNVGTEHHGVPRAETRPTPELNAALARLQTRHSDKYVSVQRKEGVWFDGRYGEGSSYSYYQILIGPKSWRKPTLGECLALADGVRDTRETENVE